VKKALDGMVHRMSNDVTIFPAEAVALFEPYVILDLSQVKLRGLYRNAFSLNSATSGVCMPIPLECVGGFDPLLHATTQFQLNLLDSQVDSQERSYRPWLGVYGDALSHGFV